MPRFQQPSRDGVKMLSIQHLSLKGKRLSRGQAVPPKRAQP